MNLGKISPRLVSAMLIALFFGVSLYIRTVLPFEHVFSGEWIKSTGIDAYSQMRIVDNLVSNFPHTPVFDPYYIYPGGSIVSVPLFFHWLLGGITWLIGLGSPSQQLVDTIGAYFPAVLAALTIIPVYFIGRELFGRWAGVIAAGLIAVMPGEFLGRSILGFTDYHILECLLTTTAMLFFVLALRTAKECQLTPSHFRRWDWPVIGRPFIYSLLAGIMLGIYRLAWSGALLFFFIVSVFFIIQFIINHLKRESTDYLGLVGATVFLTTMIIILPITDTWFTPSALIIALLIPVALNVISRLMAGRGIRPFYYPLAVVCIGLVGLGIFRLASPSLLGDLMAAFQIFRPQGTMLTVFEMQSLFTPIVAGGSYFNTPAWGNFYISLILSFISLIMLIYLAVRQGNDGKTLLIVWSLVILAAAIGQRRFAYYLAINVALLAAYFSWEALQLAGFKERGADPVFIKIIGWFRRRSPGSEEPGSELKGYPGALRYSSMALAVIAIFFLTVFPNFKSIKGITLAVPFAPSDAWCASLSWLKGNTPEPFGEADFYYERYEAPPPGEEYAYPESAYGIISWWDYGYWITRIAHRLPNSCPGPTKARDDIAYFYTAEDENAAREIVEKLDSAYVVIDYATVTTKFWAVAEWAGLNKSRYYGIYYLLQENGELNDICLFYPEYYRSLCVRLYNFDGQAVVPEETVVIRYEGTDTDEGVRVKLLTWADSFPTYEEALSFVSEQDSPNYRIISTSAFRSPVPLEAVRDYKLIYSSDNGTIGTSAGEVPEVKIFEYTAS